MSQELTGVDSARQTTLLLNELAAKEVNFNRPIMKFYARIRNAEHHRATCLLAWCVVAEARLVACPR